MDKGRQTERKERVTSNGQANKTDLSLPTARPLSLPLSRPPSLVSSPLPPLLPTSLVPSPSRVASLSRARPHIVLPCLSLQVPHGARGLSPQRRAAGLRGTRRSPSRGVCVSVSVCLYVCACMSVSVCGRVCVRACVRTAGQHTTTQAQQQCVPAIE